MAETAGESITNRSRSILIGVLTAAAGAAMAYFGPSVPLKLAGAERALRGLEIIQAAMATRKATVSRRKRAVRYPGPNKRKWKAAKR